MAIGYANSNPLTPSQLRYAEKLKDPRWRAKAEKIVKDHGGQCEECGSRLQLTVHHVHYIRGREPWDYPDELLMCLCWPCHQERQMFEEALMLGVAIFLRHRRTQEIKETPAWVFFYDNLDQSPI